MIGEMKAKLSPCPFCGGDARLENYIVEAAVFCTSCRATIKRGHEPKRDVGISNCRRAWNTRAAVNGNAAK